MKRITLILISAFVLCMISADIRCQQLAFPGAEGYGKYTTGGRGGRIVEVTSLKDQDRFGKTLPGTLREALNTPGTDPITIVFRISGIIELKTELKSSRPNMTIAGQTAPGDGICIKDESIKLSGDNLIIRYIRFRPGDELKGQASALNVENASNIIVDHCSMSWAIEENATFYDTKYISVQWCIISEGLYDSYHEKGPRGYGGQWGGQYSSYHHNLLAHNRSRSPRINGCRSNDTIALIDFRNNVVFNWGVSGAIYGGEVEIFWDKEPNGSNDAGNFTNMINNYYKPGPGTASGKSFCRPTYVTDGNIAYGFGKWHLSGNYMEGITGGINDNNWSGIILDDISGNGGKLDSIKHDVEFDVSEVPTYTPQQAYDSVLAYAGAIRPIRDSVDIRILREIKGEITIVGGNSLGAGSGLIDSQTEVGGWPAYNSPLADSIPADSDKDGIPDYWETENSLNPNDSLDGPVISGDGYSNLEHYLNSDIPFIKPFIPEDTTSSNSTKTVSLNIFPNPVTNIICFDKELEIKNITIYSLVGKKLFEQNITNFQNTMQVEFLNPGAYILKAGLPDGSFISQKFIKK